MARKNNILTEDIMKVVESARDAKDPTYTYFYYLDNDDPMNDWAIVFCWVEEGEGDDKSVGVIGKVAYQPKNSLMQEYDIDWVMPYDEITGDVWDTEIFVDCPDDVDWLLKNWYEIKEQYIDKEEE